MRFWNPVLCASVAVGLCGAPASAERITISLDGQWEIADSVQPEAIPERFDRKVPVPGLANLARPPFADIDRFDSRELIWNLVRRKQLPESALTEIGRASCRERV